MWETSSSKGAQLHSNFDRMTEVMRRMTQSGALPVAVGGDHSISLPLVRGLEPLDAVDVVYLDAHADFIDHLDGSRVSGASEMRRIRELPFVRSVTALGIRNVDRAEVDGMRDLGVRWATALDLVEGPRCPCGGGTGPALTRTSTSLSISTSWTSRSPPGTRFPSPGAFSYRQLHSVLDQIARQGKVIAFDVAELNPALDAGEVTARTAAWLITHFLSEILEST